MKRKSVFGKCISQILSHEQCEIVDYYIKKYKEKSICSETEYRRPYFLSKKKSTEKYCIFPFTMEGPLILAIAKQYIFIAEWAEKNGYIPVIDLEYEQVYKEGRIGEDNEWEYCFQSKLGIHEVLKKDYVFVEAMYSNYYMDEKTCLAINNDPLDCNIHVCQQDWRQYYKNVNMFAKKHWKFNETFMKRFETEVADKLDTGKVLGISMREEFSVDVNDLLVSPKARAALAMHPLACGVAEIIKIAKEYMKRWNCNKIFLSTICQETVDMFVKEFGEQVITVNRQRSTFEEIAKKVSEDSEAPIEERYKEHLQCGEREKEYEKTITYVQEAVALSKCQYLIGMKSSATTVALSLNGGEYEDIYILPDMNQIKRY